MTDEKAQSQQDVPFINWRYILFKWNDSEEEMNLARQRAVEIGVDRLTWEITDHPENAFSRRFVPGSADLVQIEHEVWDTSNLGNAIPGATPRARIEIPAAAALNPPRGAGRHAAEDRDASLEPELPSLPGTGLVRPSLCATGSPALWP